MAKNNQKGRIFCMISLFLTFFLFGCSQPTQTDKLASLGLPSFTINLLKISANDCVCELSDSKQVTCQCSNPNWDKNVRIVCKTPPVDTYDAVNNCFAVTLKK